MKIIDRKVLNDLGNEASENARRRLHRNYHDSYGDKVQRLINLIHRDSYIRPHRHRDPDKFEVFIILSGSVAVIEFDEEGTLVNTVRLDHEQGNYAVELPPRSYHTIVSLVDGSTVYEIKQGPYEPHDDKELAAWAPEEGSPEAGLYLSNLRDRVMSRE